MYSVPQSEQLTIFLSSLGLGFILGILYDALRLFRIALTKTKIGIIVFDIVYFTLVAVASFLFILALNKGEVRFYIIIGEAIGFFFYYFSFGIVAIKSTNKIISTFQRIFSFLKKIILLPVNYIKKGFNAIFFKIKGVFQKTFKKTKKLHQKHLPKLRLYVYNLLGILFTRHNSSKKGGSDFGKAGKKEQKEKSL